MISGSRIWIPWSIIPFTSCYNGERVKIMILRNTDKKNMPAHIAIVSYFSIGAYDVSTVDENKILSDVLTELDISHEIVIWSDPDVKWESFSCLLIKSVWDYFDYYPEFLDWMDPCLEFTGYDFMEFFQGIFARN
jgi:hypothetical protein